MLVREYQLSDLEAIDKIWREHHSHQASMPHRKNRLVEAVIENDGKVLGYGQVKAFAEAMMFLDMSLSTFTRARAFKLMLDKAIKETQALGITELYAFARDPDFALLLERKFSFERVDDPGELLMKGLS